MGKLLTGVLLVMGLSFASRELWLALGENELDYAAIYAERRRLEQESRARRSFIEIRDATLRSLDKAASPCPTPASSCVAPPPSFIPDTFNC